MSARIIAGTLGSAMSALALVKSSTATANQSKSKALAAPFCHENDEVATQVLQLARWDNVNNISTCIIRSTFMRTHAMCVQNIFRPGGAYMRRLTGWAMLRVMACRLFENKPLPEPSLPWYQKQRTLNQNTSISFKTTHKEKSLQNSVCICSYNVLVHISLFRFQSCPYVQQQVIQ